RTTCRTPARSDPTGRCAASALPPLRRSWPPRPPSTPWTGPIRRTRRRRPRQRWPPHRPPAAGSRAACVSRPSDLPPFPPPVIDGRDLAGGRRHRRLGRHLAPGGIVDHLGDEVLGEDLVDG